jgi:tetratricopeptide (TPR) repeat protein
MPALAQPANIGDYVIDAERGRGAHGVVYRAHLCSNPQSVVALKIVESRGNLDRLLLEPTLLSHLDHPCIVGIDDYFTRQDDLVLALEYIDGQDLQTLLHDGALFSQDEVRDMLVQLAGALAHAHERNIIHRDIKPSNILVVREKGRTRFVLTDFGIGRTAEGIQQEKHTGGTYLFMAPEQLRGRPGPQSDLWALGVVAYRLLTGKQPFPGPSLAELSQQILYATPPAPGQVVSGPMDSELDRIVMRLMDKSLQERTGSAMELLRELGFRGKPQEVLRRPARRGAKKAGATLDHQLRRSILVRQAALAVLLLIYLMSGGVFSGTICLLGIAVFFWGQSRRGSSGTWASLGALGLLAVHCLLRYVFTDLDRWATQGLGRVVEAVTSWLGGLLGPGSFLHLYFTIGSGIFFVLFLLFLPVFLAAVVVAIRRLRRQIVLRQAALAGDAGSATFLAMFRQALDSRFEDVDFHLKYAEALFNCGRLDEAAVEARLVLRQDPYHFGGNLLLAHAYQRLGLYEDARKACEKYLAINNHCFEFKELLEQCRRGPDQA